MSFMDFINEQIYMLFSMYYYEVFLYRNNIQVGRIIQSVGFSPTFIVDFKRKLAFVIVKEYALVKGHKLILHYNVDFGLPLKMVEETQIESFKNGIVKMKTVNKLSGSFTEEQIKKSSPNKITESNLPPHMIFEIFNAHFVTKTLSKPKTTDWFMVALVIGFVVALLGGMLILSWSLKGSP